MSSELELEMRTYHNEEAPLAANNQKVMLKLTAPASSEDGKKPELDLVVVLDTSGSMRGHKLHDLKTAMNYVIRKLGQADRLSIIPFSTTVEKKPNKLVYMNSDAKEKAARLVHDLKGHGSTDITAGLKAGLKALQERVDKDGRAAGILLMSDGLQNHGADARKLADIGNVTIHTFGFGSDHDPAVLEGIATKSHGGTYHYVRDDNAANLTKSFSQPLAGLRSVVLLGLKLILRGVGSTIEMVDPGTYPQTRDAGGSVVTVNLGDLYRHESRWVVVFLLLPEAGYEHRATVMTAEYEYSVPGVERMYGGDEIQMNRIETADPHAIKLQVKMELVRRDHASSIRKVKTAADNKKLHDANEKLEDALKALEEILENEDEDEDEDEGAMARAMVESLSTELDQLRDLMVSQELYKKQGHAYALASISSHERQRFTARGGVDHVRLFATPRMGKYLDHAIQFHEDPDVDI